MKITRTTERIKGGKDLTTFFVDGTAVATCLKYREYFCTIKNGAPSNIRDRTKNAYDIKWIRQGLEKVLGTNEFSVGYKTRPGDFNDDYPDTTWGYPGSVLTNTKVKNAIEQYMCKEVKKILDKGSE